MAERVKPKDRPVGRARGRGAAVAPSLAKPISPARAAAFELLQRISATSAHSDDVLHGPRLTGLSQADRNLTTALVLGVLRWQIALDARLQPLLSRPDLQVAEPVAVALRLGALQLLHMERVPPHAALNESVELVRSAGHAHAAGLVNAVLRKVAAAPPPRRPLVEPVEAMAERLGHPLWLATRWERAYGRSAAEAICAFDQKEPGCPSLFAAVDGEAPFPLMDPGSRLVAELAAVAGAGAERVWDCCAAPGGKTVVLARRLSNADLLATDTSPVRTRRLKDRLKREAPATSRLTVEQANAEALPSTFGDFDLILCDVPCSGTGTLSRNPEIRHRLEPADLVRQADRQRKILGGALGRLGPGGRLVYSTCSLENEECEAVVDAVVGKGAARIARLPVEPMLEQLASEGKLLADQSEWGRWVRNGFLRTLPGAGFEGDGFFAAVLQRQG